MGDDEGLNELVQGDARQEAEDQVLAEGLGQGEAAEADEGCAREGGQLVAAGGAKHERRIERVHGLTTEISALT